MSAGRSVFITGVSSGLGAGLARHYLRQTATVYGISRRVPHDLIDAGLIFESVDLRDHQSTQRVVAALLEHVVDLSLAVLNAGVLSPFGDLAEQSLSTVKEVTDVNLWANKTIIDSLYAKSRRIAQIVAISSGAAVNGNRGWNAYSISKAGLNMLMKLYAAEHPETHFCALAPGLIDTAMQEQLCGLPSDPRFPALASLKSRRGTAEMPNADQTAVRIAAAIEHLPTLIASGDFTDIRKAPLKDI